MSWRSGDRQGRAALAVQCVIGSHSDRLGACVAFCCFRAGSAGVPLPGGVDALLLLVAVARPDLAWVSAAAAVVGSIWETYFLFTLAQKGGQAYLEKHSLNRRGRVLQEWFKRYGLVTVFVPALLPIPMPMKVPVVCTAVFGFETGLFWAVVAAASIPRYFGLAWFGRQFGENAAGWLKAMPGTSGLCCRRYLSRSICWCDSTIAVNLPRHDAANIARGPFVQAPPNRSRSRSNRYGLLRRLPLSRAVQIRRQEQSIGSRC